MNWGNHIAHVAKHHVVHFVANEVPKAVERAIEETPKAIKTVERTTKKAVAEASYVIEDAVDTTHDLAIGVEEIATGKNLSPKKKMTGNDPFTSPYSHAGKKKSKREAERKAIDDIR